MKKHFSALLAIMDSAEIVPDEIRLTKDRDIVITSEFRFDDKFYKEITEYCDINDLDYNWNNFPNDTFLIKNSQNAAI